jgi:hypothetical protein
MGESVARATQEEPGLLEHAKDAVAAHDADHPALPTTGMCVRFSLSISTSTSASNWSGFVARSFALGTIASPAVVESQSGSGRPASGSR